MHIYENQLERRLAFEQIISRMARNFVHLSKAREGINVALEEIGQFSGASRAYIFEFQTNMIYMDNTYEWCDEDVTAEIDHLKNQEIAFFPWWMEKIKSGDVLNIHDVSVLGPEATAERDILEMQGIKSVLVLPLMKRGTLSGFVGFDNVKTVGTWHKEDNAVLSIAAEFFSNVFDRLTSEKELSDAKDELEASLSSLQTMQSQLIQQEHMVAIGQLAAGIAHEINNPLGFVLSNQKTLRQYTFKLMDYAEKSLQNDANTLLSDSERKDALYIKEDLDEVFADIDIGLQRVKKIVESLRFFSRIDSVQAFEPYNLKEGIENTLTIIHSRLSESVELELDIDEQLPMVVLHGSKMNQVILNLIVNALDAIADRHQYSGGMLKISAKTVERGNKKEKERFLEIVIEDNGTGMSDEVKQKIYNPFFTTKPVGKGTGLGMILVYDIVKNLHKGDIIIESELGIGTKITLVLPLNLEVVHAYV